MFYILDETGKVVSTATKVANPNALQAAGYTVVESELSMGIGDVEVKAFTSKPVIVAKTVRVLPRIVMSVSPEMLPADGKSKASLKVSLEDEKGAPLKKAIEVGFQTTAGTMSQRSVKTSGGKATVSLTAASEPGTARVVAVAQGYAAAVLTMVFGKA
jgi:hypothetical protein